MGSLLRLQSNAVCFESHDLVSISNYHCKKVHRGAYLDLAFLFFFFFSQSRTYTWNTCPEGYFLQGFYNPKDLLLGNHETATCCRPRNFKNTPAHPTDCEDNYVNNLIGREGWWRCKEWFYLTAVYQDNCDKTGCTEFFTCCRMPPSGTSSFHQT